MEPTVRLHMASMCRVNAAEQGGIGKVAWGQVLKGLMCQARKPKDSTGKGAGRLPGQKKSLGHSFLNGTGQCVKRPVLELFPRA